MYQPNFERIAQKIVQDSLRAQAGEQGLLTLRSDTLPYGELICAAAFRQGASMTVLLQSDEMTVAQATLTPEGQLPSPWLPYEAAIRASDFTLIVGMSMAEPGRMAAIPPERLHSFFQRRRSRDIWVFGEGGPRWLGTDYPTRYMAQGFNIPWGRLHELFWRAMDVDYGLLYERVAALADHLQRADHFHLTTPRGTDLRFRRGQRPVIRDDGRVEDVGNLPAGEITFSPLEESVEGHLVAEQGRAQGELVEGLEVRFEGGVATPLRAARGFEPFLAQWEAATGDKARLGEVGMGVNPALEGVIGYDLLDQKSMGLFHVALGDNDLTGGANRSTLRWTTLLQQATFTAEGRALLVRGRFAPGLLR